jgi:hypothetical protein
MKGPGVMNTSDKYKLLRTIAFILQLLAWLALAVGVIGALIALLAGIPGALKLVGLVTALLVGIGWFVQLYAFGGILSLLADIEENTGLLAAPSATK